ncbi:MAG: protein kinase [Pirellulaceae bacterium]
MNEPSQDLSALFEAAIQIESDQERREFVDRACGGNDTLKAELERLLESNSKAAGFLSSPPPGLGKTCVMPENIEDGPSVSPSHGSVLELLGQTVDGKLPRVALESSPIEGPDPVVRPRSAEMPRQESNSRYRLDGEIARGGMGAVLKGRDTDLGRDLAFKVLLDEHRDKPAVIQRFVEEAQIGGQLQHPGIAPVYELGQFQDQRPFFTMKLVKGQTLSALLSERRSPADDRAKFLGIFEQVCQTMAYAHSRGVIHRDLKPANIMVGAFGEVQVMDWGLAKVLSAGGIADERKEFDDRTRVSIIQTIRSLGSDTPDVGSVGSGGSQTQMGSVLGTPAYMPPEQALGEIDRLDQRSDVFGLGAILCQILTGDPPYTGDSHTEVFRKASRAKLQECYDRLSEHVQDDELIAIARDSLQPEPEDRIRDAGVLAHRVADYLESVDNRLREAELQRAAEAARVVEERKRRKLFVALAGTAMLTLILAGGGWMWIQQQQAAMAQAKAEQNRELHQQIASELSTARTLANLDEQGLPTVESVDRSLAAIQRAQALIKTGDVEEWAKDDLVALTTAIRSLRSDFALVAALDEAWQKEMDYQTQRENWVRVLQMQGNAVNAQGAAQDTTSEDLGSDSVPSLFSMPNPAVHYEKAFADWGLTLSDDRQTESTEKLKALDPELQAIAFNGLDRWRNLLKAPLQIEEWQQLQWKFLEPVELKSNAHTEFAILEDQSILASGPTPHAGYELVFDTDVKEISAIRMEAMLHDSLPNRGPGRSSNGVFRSQNWVHYAPLDAPQLKKELPLQLRYGTADYNLRRAFVEYGHWHIIGGAGRPHAAVYWPEESVRSASGFRIWITSPDRERKSPDQWGRMRFSVLQDTAALAARRKTIDWLAELLQDADSDSWRSEMRNEIDNAQVVDLITRAGAELTNDQPTQYQIQLAEYLAYRDNRQLGPSWPQDVKWHALENVQLSAANGTELSITDDAVIQASGPNPSSETITVAADLPVEQVSALRLELIEDRADFVDPLGRGDQHHVVIQEIEFQLGDGAEGSDRGVSPTSVLALRGSEPFHSTALLREAVDDNLTTHVWFYDAGNAQHDRTILFAFDPESTGASTSIRIQLRCGGNQGNNPKWFRLSATNDDIPVARIWSDAQRLLERAVANDPTDYRVRLALSQLLIKQLPPNYSEALRHASAAVALRPNATGGHAAILAAIDVSNIQLESSSSKIALAHAEALRQIDPHHPAINDLVEKLIQYGQELSKKKNHSQAESVYRLSLQLRSPNVVTYFSMLSSLTDSGRYPLAEESAQRVIELDPTNPQTLNWMGAIHGGQSNNEEAIRWYRKAIEAKPSYTLAYRNLAGRLTAVDRKDEAIAVLKDATMIAPLEAQNFDDLGDTLSAADKPDESIAAYRKATELAPYDGHYRLALANKLRMERRIDEAIEVWKNAIELDPDDFSPRNNLAVFYFWEGRIEEAAEEQHELVRRHPQERYAHFNVAHTLEILERDDEVHSAFQHWIEQLPGDRWAYASYADFLKAHEDPDKAIEMYRTAIRISPKYAYAYHKLGELLEEEDRIDEAIELYKQEIVELPRTGWPYQALARLLRARDRFDEVIPVFEKAYHDQPGNAELLQVISQAFSVAPKASEEHAEWALELAKRAVQVRPEYQYGYRPLGVLYYRTGNFQDSLSSFDDYLRIEWKQYTAASNVSYNVAIALSFKAMAAFKLGQEEQAHEYLGEAEGALRRYAFIDSSILNESVPSFYDWNNWLLANGRRALDEARTLMGMPTEFSDESILEHLLESSSLYVENSPQDSQSILELCNHLAHAGKSEQVVELCRNHLNSLTEESNPVHRMRFARAYFLIPSSDPTLLQEAISEIEFAMKSTAHTIKDKFWTRTVYGMSQYRMGNYAEAEETLTPTINWDADLRESVGRHALLFRSMARQQLGKHDEALADFRRAEANLNSLTAIEKEWWSENNPVFYGEARQLLDIDSE